MQLALIVIPREQAGRRSTNRRAEETLAERRKDQQMSENPIQLSITTFENESQDKLPFRLPEAHSAPTSDDGLASA
jgi:hypothetical protein